MTLHHNSAVCIQACMDADTAQSRGALQIPGDTYRTRKDSENVSAPLSPARLATGRATEPDTAGRGGGAYSLPTKGASTTQRATPPTPSLTGQGRGEARTAATAPFPV